MAQLAKAPAPNSDNLRSFHGTHRVKERDNSSKLSSDLQYVHLPLNKHIPPSRTEPRVLGILSTSSTTELHRQPSECGVLSVHQGSFHVEKGSALSHL